jgi:hypothetical protein
MVALRRALLRSRLLAWVLVVLTVLGSSGSWHVDTDDPDFAASVPHDHSHHHERFDRPSTTSAPEHCAICHWLQAFRSDSAAQTRVAFQRDESTPAARAATTAPLSTVFADVPSRAPPLRVA